MPRLARLDAPGVLHHVIIRGIERRKIFRDRTDQTRFVDRLSKLVQDTQARCYAWALMRNHAHFLLRSGTSGISALMQRLLTGYVVTFNRRHKRHGQLFQNRYKSIVCQEDAYLKELVRYIHLNPIRAKTVKDLNGLSKYTFCGHGMLAGEQNIDWQDDRYVLSFFSDRVRTARKRYVEYMQAGLDQGRRPELVGGGVIRSMGGWKTVKRLRLTGMDRIKGDERILGDSDFVQSILDQANEKFERSYELERQGVDMDYLAAKAASLYRIETEDIYSKSRQKLRAEARGLFCYWAVQELGVPLSVLARRLKMTPAGIGYAVQRGEAIARDQNYQVLE